MTLLHAEGPHHSSPGIFFLYKLYRWLSHHPMINLVAVLGYFIFILFAHDVFVRLSVTIMEAVTLPVYNVIVAIVCLILFLAFLAWLIMLWLKQPEARPLKISYFFITILFMAIHSRINFVMNIEIIHSAQYMLLAILLFPLTGRYGKTVFWVAILGLIDEIYQYQCLYPDKVDYLDLNDMVMNCFGAGLGVILLFSSGVNNRKAPSIWKNPAVYLTVLLLGGTALLFHLNFLSVYFDRINPPKWFPLNESPFDEGFWRAIPDTDIVYHVMQPPEGFLVLSLIILFYYFLDLLSRKQQYKGLTT